MVATLQLDEKHSPIARCVAELLIQARRYTAGDITHGDLARGGFDGGELRGLRGDGRWLFRFGHVDDAMEFRDSVTLVAESYGLDGDADVLRGRDGHFDVPVLLAEVRS